MAAGNDPITLAAAEEALTFVSSDDRRNWVRLGKALYDEFGDSSKAAWFEWSARSDSFKERDAESVWSSLVRMSGSGRPVTIGTLIYEATRGGWRRTGAHTLRETQEERERRAAERAVRREEAARREAAVRERAAARAREVWESATTPAPVDHPYLVRKRVKATGLRFVPMWRQEYMDEDSGELRTVNVPNALLVPIWSSPGNLSALQAIFGSSKNVLRRDKDYLAGGRKQGCYHLIGKIDGETVYVAICEGWATGMSLHEATGWPVMVCLDAGNLEPIAVMVRARLPKATIVCAADNDQYPRADGSVRNTGVEAATKAAKAVNGVVAVPNFRDLTGKPTDWNDLAVADGLEMVRAQLEMALNPPPAPAPEPAPAAPGDEAQKGGDAKGDAPAAPPAASPAPAAPGRSMALMGHDPSEHFRVLGYDHGTYYFLSCEKRQIVECSKGDFGDVGLLELAPLDWWELEFPGAKGGVEKKMAANWLIRACHAMGVYDNSRIRGRGAWTDAGRIVYHHGEKLSVDGRYQPVESLASRYVYEVAKPLPEPADEMMTGDFGEWLLEIAGMFRWKMAGSAALLAGWVALAPICGALRWRPHIWCTGGPGSGKSTIMNQFVHFLLGGVNIFAQGSSTEAGIRQTLKTDALPVLFDESESNEEGDARRVQNILTLIRQASTESHAQTYKGTAGGDAMSFHIRSMFALSSVQVAIKHQADIERLTVLALKSKNTDQNAAATWETMSARLDMLAKEQDLPGRLLRRSLNLLPVTLKSIEIFSNAFAQRFGSVRDGDQYGTLLAGAWSMISDRLPRQDEAFEFIDRYDWSEHREANDTDDSERALGALLEARVRVQGGIEVTVSELVRVAAGKPSSGLQVGAVDADAMLQRYGIRITQDNRHMLVSNNSRGIRELMDGTPFVADTRSMLLRLRGATNYDNKAIYFNGAVSKCVAVPLDTVLADGSEVTGSPPPQGAARQAAQQAGVFEDQPF